jgi:amino acid transporter
MCSDHYSHYPHRLSRHPGSPFCFKSPTFAEAAAALSSIVFAFCGIPAYFNVVSEMKDHKDYFKALSLCQFVMTSIYIAIGVVVYYYCGSYVASPALGSAGVLMKKICYGLALPGLLASVILVTHVSYTISLLFCSLQTMY